MALQEISKNESEGNAKEAEDRLHKSEYIAEVNKEKLKGGQGSKIGGVLAESVVGGNYAFCCLRFILTRRGSDSNDSITEYSLHHMVRLDRRIRLS